jgi:dsDNA-specific endonuclease/ATPase MutS2
MCVAVAASEKPPKGILLGSGGGGSVMYLEPPAAVPLNNELAAARGEAFSAEEAVLWRLTGRVVEAAEDLQRVLDAVCSPLPLSWLKPMAFVNDMIASP